VSVRVWVAGWEAACVRRCVQRGGGCLRLFFPCPSLRPGVAHEPGAHPCGGFHKVEEGGPQEAHQPRAGDQLPRPGWPCDQNLNWIGPQIIALILFRLVFVVSRIESFESSKGFWIEYRRNCVATNWKYTMMFLLRTIFI